MGIFGSGILVVGDEGFFIDQQRDKKDVARFTLDLTEKEEERLKYFYDDLIANGIVWEPSDKKNKQAIFYRFPEGHPYTTYTIAKPNCTTVLVDGLKFALGKRFPSVMAPVFVPSELYTSLKCFKSLFKQFALVKKK